MLPTGKAHQDDLRRLFAKPGRHVFRDASISISFVGPHVVEYLLSPLCAHLSALKVDSLLSKAVSACDGSELNSLLRSAVESCNTKFVKDLIDFGADGNHRGCDGQSVMSLAVRSGEIEVIRALLSGCEFESSVDRWLHDAAATDRVDIMEVLCSEFEGIDVNSVDSNGRTPIHVAAIGGYVDCIQFCVSMGGDCNLMDFNGRTPLHCAALEGNFEAVKFLLDCSLYSKYALTKDGKTAFALAVEKGYSHLYDLLQLSDVLHRSASVGDVHGMKTSLAEGAEVNGRDQNGWTPLHRAAFKGRIDSVKLLLDHGVEVDVVDNDGYSPLHCAMQSGHLQVALCLISHGAQANSKSFKGLFPSNLDCFLNHHSLALPPYSEKGQS